MTGFTLAYAVMRVCGGQPRKNPGAPLEKYRQIHVDHKIPSSGQLLELLLSFGVSCVHQGIHDLLQETNHLLDSPKQP